MLGIGVALMLRSLIERSMIITGSCFFFKDKSDRHSAKEAPRIRGGGLERIECIHGHLDSVLSSQ